MEVLLKGFLPEELLLLVLRDKVVSCFFNLSQVVVDYLHRGEEFKLILDFNEIVSVVSIKTGHLDSERDEIIHYFHDDISDTILSGSALDGWIKLYLSVSEINLDVEHGRELMVLVVMNVDLVRNEVHRSIDTLGNSFNNESIDIVDIS